DGLFKAYCVDDNMHTFINYLDLNDRIANMDGVLTRVYSAGKFIETCKDFSLTSILEPKVTANDITEYLNATCQKKDGSWVKTRIALDTWIENVNGLLKAKYY